ncbi:MAG: dTDP-4-dehydrorhamnose reductase [Chloroflexota bacterium]
MRIIVTGANGKVGSQLAAILSKQHDVVGYDLEDLDIVNFEQVRTIVYQQQPDLVINAAAWTDVDGCARDPERAVAINGYGAQNLAIATHDIGGAILQISSNEVFDGHAKRSYHEYDAMNPVNPYGYSKMVGERSVIQTNPRHYIVRISWLFAHGGHNFIHAILNAVHAGKQLRVVVDEVANPTYNDDCVEAIAQLIETKRYGTYHFCNAGYCSRHEFARYFLDRAGYSDIPIAKISRHQWSRPSTPPVYTSLANTFGKQLGITLRPWQNAVDMFLEKEDLLTIAE